MTRATAAVDASSFTTDAKFRTWGSALAAMIAATGLVKTSDTGQIDWVTVAKPAAQGYAGYEIYRFNDTLQSTAPIYIKLDYGVGSPITTAVTRITIGTGSDGAGNITGIKTAASNGQDWNLGVAGDNTNLNMLGTHTEGYAFVWAAGSVTSFNYFSSCFFAIDRSRNQSTGAPTADGMYIMFGFSNGTPGWTRSQSFSFFPVVAMPESAPAMLPPGDSSSYSGSIFPHYWSATEPKVCVGMVGCMTADVADFSTFTAKPIGTTTTHTYITIKGIGTGQSMFGIDSIGTYANEANIRTAFLWED